MRLYCMLARAEQALGMSELGAKEGLLATELIAAHSQRPQRARKKPHAAPLDRKRRARRLLMFCMRTTLSLLSRRRTSLRNLGTLLRRDHALLRRLNTAFKRLPACNNLA